MTNLRVDASSILPGHSAGIEAFTYGLISGLASTTPHRLEVEIINGTAQDWRLHVPDGGVRWLEVDMALRLDGPMGSRLRRYLPTRVSSSWLARQLINAVRDRSRQRPSVAADVTFYPFHGVPIVAEPAVVVVHDLRHFNKQLGSAGYSSIIRRNVAKASAVVVSWPHPYEQVLGMFPEARCKTVLIPPPTFHARPADRRHNPEPGLLLYPSSTAPHKNHATLVEAMALLPEYRLVCPGPLVEPQATSLTTRAGRSDVVGRVSFPGFVSVGELEDLYARASAVVVPSTWEAASAAIFEAFSWGLPVACADVEPIRAQVDFAGGDVCFFDPTDPGSLAEAVRNLAERRDYYAAASREASRRLAGRTWADTAGDYCDVFDWVAGGHRSPVPRSRFMSGGALHGMQS